MLNYFNFPFFKLKIENLRLKYMVVLNTKEYDEMSHWEMEWDVLDWR